MGSSSPRTFSPGRFGKLQPRADGPFRVLRRINDNAHKVDLPGHYNVSATFNVADLSPYEGDDLDSRTSPFHDGENDTVLDDVPQTQDDPDPDPSL